MKNKSSPGPSLSSGPVLRRTIDRWQNLEKLSAEDRLAIEEPFEIRVNGKSLAVIMRTPGPREDKELAVGFLLSEGVISDPLHITSLRRALDEDGLPEENVIEVGLSQMGETGDNESRFERRFTVSSSCGLCGKNSILEVCRWLPPLPPTDFKVPVSTIYNLPDRLRKEQVVFESTGGLHAAGLFNSDGSFWMLREDVGRHNAVDKLVGKAALDNLYPLGEKILMVSGRASFEIIQKALVARIPIVAAVSAPSSLAIELAEEAGLTLIGFLRGQTMNVYTGNWRIFSG